MELVEVGNTTAVKRLMDTRKPDVNYADEDGKCPILIAASRNDLDMLRLLISFGAEVGVKDIYGRSVQHYARKHHNEAMESIVIECSARAIK